MYEALASTPATQKRKGKTTNKTKQALREV
jgi:hypothetical protein